MDKFKEYEKILTKKGRTKDCAAFEKYAKGEIELEECFNMFLENNKPTYKEELFKGFLKSLGYSRPRKRRA